MLYQARALKLDLARVLELDSASGLEVDQGQVDSSSMGTHTGPQSR